MTKKPGDDTLSIKVWDLPTRIFHWSLVVLALLAWITSEADGALFRTHLWTGYGVMGLIVFRLIWGFIGTRHPRFSKFIHPWPVVRKHLRDLLSQSPAPSLGHTPAGGWMIAALLAMMVALVATGLFAGDDGESGPLVHWVAPWLADGLGELHEALNSFLWTLVLFHVGTVFIVSHLTRDNLIAAMRTGRKANPERFHKPDDTPGHPADIHPAGWLCTITAVLATFTVIWMVAG